MEGLAARNCETFSLRIILSAWFGKALTWDEKADELF